MTSHTQYPIKTVIGHLYLVASDSGLRGIHWKRQAAPIVTKLNPRLPAHKILSSAEKQLAEYFSGKRKKFDIPLEWGGTQFQKKVWTALAKIPYGATCSYSDLAKNIRHDRAVRAVGTANGKNPFSIIIPCHRVIHQSGGLGGYAGGLKIKNQLLELERIKP